MKKRRILAALSAFVLTGSLFAVPFSVSAEVKIPRVYRYYAFGAMKYLLYDTKNADWYSETGEALSVTQTDRQQVRFEDKIYTADFAEMKVYDADENEVPALSYFLAESVKEAKKALAIWAPDPKGGTPSPDISKTVDKPVHMQAADIANEKATHFGFDASIAGVEGSFYGSTGLMKDYEKIRQAGLDADSITLHDTEYWHIETVVLESVSTLESYTDTGDVNLDGTFTVADAVLTARASAEDKTVKMSALGLALGDLNGDGTLTVLDVNESLKRLVFGEVPAAQTLTWKALYSFVQAREQYDLSYFSEYQYTTPSGEEDGLPTYCYPMDNGWSLQMTDTSVLDKTKTQEDMIDSAILTAPDGKTYGLFANDVPWEDAAQEWGRLTVQKLQEIKDTNGTVTWSDVQKYYHEVTQDDAFGTVWSFDLNNGCVLKLSGADTDTAPEQAVFSAPNAEDMDLFTADIPQTLFKPQLTVETLHRLLTEKGGELTLLELQQQYEYWRKTTGSLGGEFQLGNGWVLWYNEFIPLTLSLPDDSRYRLNTEWEQIPWDTIAKA